MGNFKKYLTENETLKQQVIEMIETLSEDEVDEFGDFLHNEFFDLEEDFIDDGYDIDDVKEMVEELGETMLEYILDSLLPEIEDELDEAVSRRLAPGKVNRKKRKFMANTKADMRATKAKRKKEARQNKTKKKRYYRANKAKISSYQKSRSAAIKKGKHKVKIRRQA